MIDYNFFFWIFILGKTFGSDSITKWEKLKKIGTPYLETYWESFTYDTTTFHYDNQNPRDIDTTMFGFDILCDVLLIKYFLTFLVRQLGFLIKRFGC